MKAVSLRYLPPISLLYLALPWALFFWGWLKTPLALIFLLLLSFPLLTLFREARAANRTDLPPLAWGKLAVLCLLALFLLGLSGVGGMGYQDTDWFKHNAVLKDLVTLSWPVYYHGTMESVISLVYYFAWYLPAALAGKLAGWLVANQFLFAWSLVGLILALLWFWALNRKQSFIVLLVFGVFSGLDIVGRALILPLVVKFLPQYAELLIWEHIEGWAIGWQYSAHLTQLFWVPHQALAGWIASGILFNGIQSGVGLKDRLYICSLTALWSPFITLGLTPFLLADFLTLQGSLVLRLRRYLSLSNLCGLAILALSALFYSAKLYEMPASLRIDIPSGFSLSFAPNTQAKVFGALVMIIFCILEFGLYAWLARQGRRTWSLKERALFWAAVIWLMLLPLYRFGGANDLVMRASIPALFVIALFVSRALHQPEGLSRRARTMLLVLLIIGSITVLIELQRHLRGFLAAGSLVDIPDPNRIIGFWDYTAEEAQALIWQYMGSAKAPFFQYLAR